MTDSATSKQHSQYLLAQLADFVRPLLVALDETMDKRLVKTFFESLRAILVFRHSRSGLLLSELGGYLLSPAQAPAGTKRLSRLLHSPKWSAGGVADFLWRQASQLVAQSVASGQRVLALWDDSALEKPESRALEGLCAVRSRRAARLKRKKPGFYSPPPGGTIFVPGIEWRALLLAGLQGAPVLAAMNWWTTRGKYQSDGHTERRRLLQRAAQAWGPQVTHVFDREFANGPWLGELFTVGATFIVRWHTRNHLVDAGGKRPVGLMSKGRRSLDQRLIWDARRQCWRQTGLFFLSVTHPDHPDQPLTLIVSRPKGKRGRWYLLTNVPIATVEDAWQVVFAYARRWQIEMTFRYSKTELALESPRLWSWHDRLKLLAMVMLVYAFLLTLLSPRLNGLRTWLLRHFCHRTGKRCRDAAIPLYRLRSALSQLWLRYPACIPIPLTLNSG